MGFDRATGKAGDEMGPIDRSFLYAFLSRHRYGVLSSVAATGFPQSALVGIAVSPELEILFDTLKESRKYPNLMARPQCSLVVGWEGEQTAQFEGVAYEPEGLELERCRRIYEAVWPDAAARRDWAGLTYFCVRPRWIRYSDYTPSATVIEEVTLPEL